MGDGDLPHGGCSLILVNVGRGGRDSYLLFKAGLFGGPHILECERFGGLWVLGSEAAELPLPLSWEPDLAAAIFISLLPRRVFL